MPKKIILLLPILIIIIFFSFWYFDKKFSTRLLPPKNQEQITNSSSNNLDSPFGIFGPYEWQLDSPNIASEKKVNDYLLDLGVKWVEEMYFTPAIKNLPSQINLYSRIGQEGNNRPPQTTQKYQEELRQVIQKYKDRIKYWEVGTEPNGFPPPLGWQSYAKEYANHLKITYQIIKKECPDCLVVLGGLSGVGINFDLQHPTAKFLREILEAGGGSYFDVFEFKQHHHQAKDYLELKNKMMVYGEILAPYKDIKKIPVFIETAMYDGDPAYPADNPLAYLDLPPQTEQEQAQGLVKTYIYGLAQGIDLILWNLVIERHNFGGNPANPFNFYGLVNNPANDGESQPKLVYYSYKKMVETLEGSDFKNIQIIEEKDDIYIYKFLKNGWPIWVAWNDSPRPQEITIKEIPLDQMINVEEVVPHSASGKEIKNYNSAFSKIPFEIISSNPLEIRLLLSKSPVLITTVKK